MYGYFPAAPKVQSKVNREDKSALDGKATLREVTLSLGVKDAPEIDLLLVIPNQRTGPAPVFAGLHFCGVHSLLSDPKIALPRSRIPGGCDAQDGRATDLDRGKQIDNWSIQQSIDRGYAVAVFYCGDVNPDHADAKDRVHAYFNAAGVDPSGPHAWGTIAGWAWGLHRVVDYLVTVPEIDPKKIIAIGHSRLGKTALVAAAFDERIALCIPHQAGCGGTAPSRGKVGESVKQINDRFPHWFNGAFKQFNEQVDRLPFDQHCLVALVAPRPVLFTNAMDDQWANPDGQFEMLQAAAPVYQLLGAGGLDSAKRPEPGKLVKSRLGYYIRQGNHSMTADDWKVFIEFADEHLAAP
jgi:hypothetical protein